VPRGGGVGLAAGIAAGLGLAWLLGWPVPSAVLLGAAAVVALVGFAEDLFREISVTARLVVQIAAAGIVAFHTGGLSQVPLPTPLDFDLGPIAPLITVLWIVSVTNIYNFLDGIDGFAALQAVLAGFAMVLLGGDARSIVLGMVISGSALGFLFHNWYPAKVFMGDVGSYLLGFLFAIMPFLQPAGDLPRSTLAIVFCLWLFLFDGVYTISRRIVRGERIWKPHRKHLYQRLVISGLRHDFVVLRVLAVAGILAVLGVAAVRQGGLVAPWSIFVLATALSCVYVLVTKRRERYVANRSQRTVVPIMAQTQQPVERLVELEELR
jgi:UDP-N-acetylmuramyl pentapeptide phosphotransferase/UDP-N-acetylglucosamine-1-phosphate transferase